MPENRIEVLDDSSLMVSLESVHAPQRTQIYASRLKRAFDVIGATTVLLLCAPLMGLVALLVKLDGGPVFFGHKRVGYGHRKFSCWKFRTMVVNADKVLADLLENDPAAREMWTREFKLLDDPRVNWLGKVLRASSVDELPQLWNVIRGEMSLVGPRPVTVAELEKYGVLVTEYLSCRPGITGLWQVSGRSKLTYDERVALDAHYVRSWTFMADLVIIFRTVSVVIRRHGAI
jgi:lipopolysaccharide/colanic/teichoic acid biosynthesis glycosyltransferase